jgi:hypothetical protein
MVNSGPFNGLSATETKKQITAAAALVRFKHINVGQDLTLNFLVSSYWSEPLGSLIHSESPRFS